MGTARETASRVRDLIEPVVAREGFELIEVELVADRGRAILRLYVDTVPPGEKGRGVTVDDCSHISHVVGDLLDVEEAVPGEYTLEVSSPGLFRPLTRPEHFDRAVGERVKIKTFGKVAGSKVFTGTLVGCEGGKIRVEVDGSIHDLEIENVAKANLEPLL